VAVALVVVTLLQSNLVQDLVFPAKKLHVLLPESGVSGLSRGAGVEILGTPAGRVRQIVVSPDQHFHAVVDIDDGMADFLRRDSVALIKRQFGIAGAAYLEIAQGKGAPLDWDYAVLSARSERGTTDNVGELIDDLRARVFPVIDQTNRLLAVTATLADGMQQGRGTAGQLMTDDRLYRELAATTEEARRRTAEAAELLQSLNRSSAEIERLSSALADDRDGLPAMLSSVNSALLDLRSSAADVRKLTRQSVGVGDELPQLVTQTQVTLRELERLLETLQNNWLIGGDAGPELGERPGANRLWR
jgi:phospholipid/cholesterol/gamma-HCH transport system substrate-binding protein